MGPRPLGRGIPAVGVVEVRDRRRFNGATTSRSWNPLGLPLRREWPARCFNGATTSRSWNANDATGTPARGEGFNGATTSRSWNLLSPADIEEVESLRFNGATTSRSWNRRIAARYRRYHSGFNGATTSRSWNLVGLLASGGHRDLASMGPRPLGRGIVPSSGSASIASWLQWGHDLSVVESFLES